MGFPVRCRRAPWVLARLSGAPLVPALIIMDRDFQFRLVIGRPIFANDSGPCGSSLELALQTYLDFLGEHIREMPWNLSLSTWERLIATG
jgi:lauroyl/myristoyl acyltransferase